MTLQWYSSLEMHSSYIWVSARQQLVLTTHESSRAQVRLLIGVPLKPVPSSNLIGGPASSTKHSSCPCTHCDIPCSSSKAPKSPPTTQRVLFLQFRQRSLLNRVLYLLLRRRVLLILEEVHDLFTSSAWNTVTRKKINLPQRYPSCPNHEAAKQYKPDSGSHPSSL